MASFNGLVFLLYHKNDICLKALCFIIQTFRQYREMFEEQKAVLEQRYRQLLEESIQDAVFLSTRNNELTQENQALKQRNFYIDYYHYIS